MNDLAATKSDLTVRIPRTPCSNARRMGLGLRLLAAALFAGVSAAAVLSCGTGEKSTSADSIGAEGAEASSEALKTQTVAAGEEAARGDDGVDWAAVLTTPPEEWSEELKAQIVAAGRDPEAIAERVRRGQATATREAKNEAPTLEQIGRRIRAAIAAGEMTPEQGRARYRAARERLGDESDGDGNDRLREFRQAVAERAMAQPPEDWSDELKAAIVRAGWDLDEFTEGIRRRQARASESKERTSGE